MAMRNFKIASRSGFCFASFMILLVALGVFFLDRNTKLRDIEQNIETGSLRSVNVTGKINAALISMRLETQRLITAKDPTDIQETNKRLDAFRENLRQGLADFAILVDGEEAKAIFIPLNASFEDYLRLQRQQQQMLNAGQVAEMVKFTADQGIPVIGRAISKGLSDLAAFNERFAAQQGEEAHRVYAEARSVLFIAIAAAVVYTVLLAWIFTHSLTQPLYRCVGVAERISKGDLTEDIVVDGSDEATDLLASLKAMQSDLRDTLKIIATSSERLASAAEEMATINQESSRGLQQQNNEVDQAATAVNLMSVAVEDVARNAASASAAARASNESAQSGQERVEKTISSIRYLAENVQGTAVQILGLSNQAQDISKVLDVIRAIAEQTNLLALNAAIEAARAGEQGRGFAVVADEVRALAHRTQESTREIEQMIAGIQSGTADAVSAMQVSNGHTQTTLEQADEAGHSLRLITAAITQIDERNLQIATASEEQARVAREVDHNLMSIRDLASHSSDGANQTAIASQELSRLAIDLNQVVMRFKLV
ncbi:Methyl-accepting chemotaxis protein McpS [compost metagenome]